MKIFSILFVVFLLLQLNTLAQEGWFWQNPLPQGNTLHDIHIFDSDMAVAIGNNGRIIKTTDGGDSWETKNSLSKHRLYSLSFPTPQIGFAVGSYIETQGSELILKTINAGDSWEILRYNTIDPLYSVHFTDNNVGYACGPNGQMIKTTDGGGSMV